MMDLRAAHFVSWPVVIYLASISVPARSLAIVLIVAVSSISTTVFAQVDPLPSKSRSAKTALGLSLLIPGLGHRYANDGHWGKSGSLFLAADIGIVLNLVGATWRKSDLEDSYRVLATGRAGANLEGQPRSFFLSLGLYDSSDEFVDVLLRTRQWDRLEGAEDPANFWEWESEQDRSRYRRLRDDAESMGRRASWMIGALVANRVLAGVTAMLRTRGTGRPDQPQLSIRLAPNARSTAPFAQVTLSW